MIAISFKFLGGRYHATPWGHHVNEGLVEWPPYPWRILRSLLACFYRKCSDLPVTSVRSVIEKMTALPSYRLPPASLGHTRHYMPQKDPLGSDKTKVFDTFTAATEPLVVIWPGVELGQSERYVLRSLVEALPYLGRAESWVEAQLVDGSLERPNCFPVHGVVSEGWERVPVLAVQEPDEYLRWLRDFRPAEAAASEGSRRKEVGKGATALPPDLWSALHAETATLQAQGWSLPPGSYWVDYCRPAKALRVMHYRSVPRSAKVPHPTVARFALAGSVLPRFTEAISLGERMRQAAMAHSRGVDDSGCSLALFSGRSADGTPLNDNHAHAFFLPADDDGDGRTDHIAVFAPAGLPPGAQTVLARLRKLWGTGGHDIFLVLVGLGQPQDYGGFNTAGGQTPQLATSRVWVSSTPYVLTRHPKTYRDGCPKLGPDGLQIDGPEAQLRADLSRRGLPPVVKVEPVPFIRMRGKNVRWLEFRRERLSGGGRLAIPIGYGFLIQFAEAVTGPLAVGYGCHFGLGQFVAVQRG